MSAAQVTSSDVLQRAFNYAQAAATAADALGDRATPADLAAVAGAYADVAKIDADFTQGQALAALAEQAHTIARTLARSHA